MSKLSSVRTTFGEYTLGQQIGEGGAGFVYDARSDDGTPVAIKILKPGLSTDKRRRFKNEIQFLMRNSHKNIISVLDHGLVEFEQGKFVPFYVMPKLSGNLRLLMKTRDPKKLLRAYIQAIEGLEAAHVQGIVHRDIKPENILLTKEEHAVLADFGIAKFAEEFLATLVKTQDTQRLANFAYASPEQRMGKNTNERTDIYAMGLILNEIFCGQIATRRTIRKDCSRFSTVRIPRQHCGKNDLSKS